MARFDTVERLDEQSIQQLQREVDTWLGDTDNQADAIQAQAQVVRRSFSKLLDIIPTVDHAFDQLRREHEHTVAIALKNIKDPDAREQVAMASAAFRSDARRHHHSISKAISIAWAAAQAIKHSPIQNSTIADRIIHTLEKAYPTPLRVSDIEKAMGREGRLAGWGVRAVTRRLYHQNLITQLYPKGPYTIKGA